MKLQKKMQMHANTFCSQCAQALQLLKVNFRDAGNVKVKFYKSNFDDIHYNI